MLGFRDASLAPASPAPLLLRLRPQPRHDPSLPPEVPRWEKRHRGPHLKLAHPQPEEAPNPAPPIVWLASWLRSRPRRPGEAFVIFDFYKVEPVSL